MYHESDCQYGKYVSNKLFTGLYLSGCCVMKIDVQRGNINIFRIYYIMILSKSPTALSLLTNTLNASLNSMRYHCCEFLVAKSHSAFPHLITM